jgi:hypothetical protein
MRGDPVIEAEEFMAFMSGMQQLNPMAKTLSASALVTAWKLFPDRAKLDLDDEMLLYAAQQLTLDPDRPKDIEPHLALLRYLYPVKRSTRTERGQEMVTILPIYDRGLRHDLVHRMANPAQFHELVRTLPEYTPAEVPRLASGGELWHQWTAAQHQAHVRGVADAVARLRASGIDDGTLINGSMGDASVLSQLNVGRFLFEKSLQGVWPMNFEAMKLSAAWVLRNPRWADDLITLALGGELKPVAPDQVVAEFVGSR